MVPACESQVENNVAKKYGKEKKDKQQAAGGMKPFVIVLGAAAVIAIGTVAWSSTRAVFSGAAVAPIDIEFADLSELVGLATGVEKGDPDAGIMIMEFGDYQCPACMQFATVVKPQVDLAFVESGIARFVFHDFPLSGHPHAFLAARAARCALDQGDDYYWPFHDQLFRNQGSWAPSPGPPLRAFQSYAEQVGLKEGAFSSCLNSDKFADVVTANIELGIQLQVTGTPTIFMSNGGPATKVTQWSDVAGFQQIVDRFQAAEAEAGDSN
jgi:protein-disulfide isomerase